MEPCPQSSLEQISFRKDDIHKQKIDVDSMNPDRIIELLETFGKFFAYPIQVWRLLCYSLYFTRYMPLPNKELLKV